MRLDQGAGHVVVLVAVPVVAHRGPVDRRLKGLQRDVVLAARDGRAGARLERGQRASGVAAGDTQQMRLGVLRQRHGASQAARVAERPAHQAADVLVVEGLQGQQQGAGQQRRDDREVRVLGRGGDQRHPAVLHRGQQRVLLGLAEPVDLVEEQQRLAPVAARLALGALDDRADLLDARGDRRQLHEAPLGGTADHVRQRGLPRAGRPPQDHRGRSRRAAAALADQSAQRRSRPQQMLLADDIVEGSRAHPDSERAATRLPLLAFLGSGGEQVGFHEWKPRAHH